MSTKLSVGSIKSKESIWVLSKVIDSVSVIVYDISIGAHVVVVSSNTLPSSVVLEFNYISYSIIDISVIVWSE